MCSKLERLICVSFSFQGLYTSEQGDCGVQRLDRSFISRAFYTVAWLDSSVRSAK